MFRRAHTAVLVTIMAGTSYPLSAHADVYVWIDNAGVMNVSNLAPPEGMRMVSVTHAAPKDSAQEAALREAVRQAEMRALNERVQQLQAEVEQARRDPPPTIVMSQPQYAPAPAAPYVIVVAPPPAPSYAQPVVGCDYTWDNCGFWPGFYPTSIVVVRDRHFRHHHPMHHAQPRHFGGRHVLPGTRSPIPLPKPGGRRF